MAEGKTANPATVRLREELEEYIEARVALMLQGVGHGLGEGARKLSEARAAGLTSTASHAKDALVDKAKGVTGKAMDVAGKRHGKEPEGGTGREHTIIEDIDVGVPVRVAYDQWTQFQDFERFAKGVESVEQEDDTTTQWHVKIGKASRHWRGNITEQVPDERIAWTSEGDKATTKGVVTFHPLGENLTKVLLVLEYFPKGVVEKAGSLVRAQGRRARLDLKLYRTFVMMRGEATGGWRGEIHEGEVSEPEASEEEPEADEEEPEDAYEDEDEKDQYDEEDEGDGGEEDEQDEEAYDAEEGDWEEDEEGEEREGRGETRSSSP
ncbi:SRPBCC family protein [Streptomyces tailanensis]|uniref:SRPBCC family protein n=1 Tax=Streptomyces tailanensis TaxID=2569858 RepID=UPI00122E3676|nr:SRPBCC family protein [Streptomyces tailanensis]